MFSKGVKLDKRARITHMLDIREDLSHEKCLGLPTFIGKSRRKPLLFIMDCIKKRLSSWMDQLVSWEGREVLIKAMAQVISTYAMSVFKFPMGLCQMIQTTINRLCGATIWKIRKFIGLMRGCCVRGRMREGLVSRRWKLLTRHSCKTTMATSKG